MGFEGVIAILSLFVGLPGIICTFLYYSKKNRLDVKKLEFQKEALELENKKLQLQLLEEESKKYDRLINEDRS
jgi:hypothetical protein